MSRVYIFLADGFEDIEGLTVVDLMRRAGIQIDTVSITDTKTVTTSHGIEMKTDCIFSETDFLDADMLVLPGGMPGTKYLGEYQPLKDLLKEFYEKGGKVAAISLPQRVCRSWFPERQKSYLLSFFYGTSYRSGNSGASCSYRRKCDYQQRAWNSSSLCIESDCAAYGTGQSRRGCGLYCISGIKLKKTLVFLCQLCYTSIMTVIVSFYKKIQMPETQKYRQK